MTASQSTQKNKAMIFNQENTPFEASDLTELAAGAIRHGMTWIVFRPEHGAFLAEGNGHVLRRVPQASLSPLNTSPTLFPELKYLTPST